MTTPSAAACTCDAWFAPPEAQRKHSAGCPAAAGAVTTPGAARSTARTVRSEDFIAASRGLAALRADLAVARAAQGGL